MDVISQPTLPRAVSALPVHICYPPQKIKKVHICLLTPAKYIYAQSHQQSTYMPTHTNKVHICLVTPAKYIYTYSHQQSTYMPSHTNQQSLLPKHSLPLSLN